MRRKIHLNFDWEFTNDFKESYLKNSKLNNTAQTVNIPHTVKELPIHHFDETVYQFISSYLKRFVVEDLEESENLILHFGAIMNVAEVYLNQTYIGKHEGGYTPFSFDITKLIKTGEENVLFIKVDSSEVKDVPPFGNVVDYLGFGGIYREVWIEILPKIYLSDIAVKTHEALSLIPSEMTFAFVISFNQTIKKQFVLETKVVDGERTVFERSYKEKNINKMVREESHIEITRWTLDDPKLYHFETVLKIGGEVVDSLTTRFGYRDMKFSFEGFSLNNEKVKLIGLNRHQSYPYVGYAMPKRMQQLDAEILKYELGCNIVRTSHYMQSDHFIDRCDEIGLLVFEEIPGWQYIGGDHFKELSVQNLTEMIQSHKNHPSIILWGTRINESPDDHDFYTILSEKAFELDDSRQIGGVRNFPNSELLEDVYTYNDFSHVGTNPGLQNPRKIIRPIVPYMVTEHNGHIFPTKKTDCEAKKVEQAIRHLRVIDSAFQYDSISGAIGWCFADYNTHKDFGSGDRVCYHGVMDMFRLPKYASSSYSSQTDKEPFMNVLSNMNPGDFERSIIDEVVILTNCDYVKIYHNDDLIGKYYADWPSFPHLPYPPIYIDDFIGSMLETHESYKKSVARRIKKLLLSYNKNGINLPFIDKLKVANLMILHKFKMSDALHLYGKYLGHWGQERSLYRFEGYKNDELVITSVKGQSRKFELKVSVNEGELLHQDTYDVARIVVSLQDEHGNIYPYGDNVIHVKTSSNLSRIGPSAVPLNAGSIGIFVKTLQTGKGKVTLSSDGYDDILVEFNISEQR